MTKNWLVVLCVVVVVQHFGLSSRAEVLEQGLTDVTTLSVDNKMSSDVQNVSEIGPRAVTRVVNGMTLTMHSPFILVFMDKPKIVSLNYSLDCTIAQNDYGLKFSLSNDYVSSISSEETVFITDVKSACRHGDGAATGELNLSLRGILLGRAYLQVDVYPGLTATYYNETRDKSKEGNIVHSYSPTVSHSLTSGSYNLSRWVVNGSASAPARFMIICMKKPTKLDSILQYTMMIYLVLLMIAMGCKTKLKVLKEVWKRPVAPAIGLFCQFVLMPMIAYVLTLVIPFPSPGMALGFFACGCAPGGGGSNFWAYLLGGDVSLSAAMTTISNIAAVGTFPMWIFSLGRVVLSDESDLKIPYVNMILSLLMVAVPLAIGTVLAYKKPDLTKKILKFLIPIVVVLTFIFIGLALYVNMYMFRLIEPILILAGALLPYIGYVLGLLLALLFKQSWTFSKTIAIETGIQNTGIAFILVMFSFPPPDNVIAATPAIASSSMTGIPLMILAAIYHIYLRCCKKKLAPNAETGADVRDDKKTSNGRKALTPKENGSLSEKEAMLEEKVSSV